MSGARTRDMRVLDYLREFIAANGYPPSMTEIAAACGFSSRSSVHHQLSLLEAKGHIRRVPNQPRAITILTTTTSTTQPKEQHQ